MKKTIVAILCLTFALVSVMVAGCGNNKSEDSGNQNSIIEQGYVSNTYEIDQNDPTHVHKFVKSITIEPTCRQAGEQICYCPLCGYYRLEQIPASWEHHHYVNGACEYCGESSIDYFDFHLRIDGKGYTTTWYNEESENARLNYLVIPSIYNGLPVVAFNVKYENMWPIESGIIMPKSITLICDWAFYEFSSTIYYKGSASDWDNIQIAEGNESLLSATRYYYSETQPAEQGNYWHYGADGVTPVIWG